MPARGRVRGERLTDRTQGAREPDTGARPGEYGNSASGEPEPAPGAAGAAHLLFLRLCAAVQRLRVPARFMLCCAPAVVSARRRAYANAGADRRVPAGRLKIDERLSNLKKCGTIEYTTMEVTGLELLEYFASVRTPFLSSLFQCFTLFGEELVVIIVLCLLYWCFDKELAYRVSFGFFLSGLLVQGAKVTFRIDRPWIADPQFEAVERAMKTATGYSFPSGHTQGAFALYGTLGLSCTRKWQGALWFLLACGVGVSRLYLGVHTPLDVLGAAGVALLSIFLVHLLFRKNYIQEHTLLVSCVLFGLSAAVLVYVFTLYHNGVVDAANAADCCKAAGAGLGFAVGYYLERTCIRFDPKEGGALWQICKLAVGFGVALLLKSGLKFVLGESLPADSARYFLVVLWIIAVFPFCFQKLKPKGRPTKRA